MLVNFLWIIGKSSKKKIVNLYICVIYRRASHAGPSAPLCFARISYTFVCRPVSGDTPQACEKLMYALPIARYHIVKLVRGVYVDTNTCE